MKLIYNLILTGSLFFAFVSNAKIITPFVNGGETVHPMDPIAKSTVMLETDSQYCSASIIDENILLTAAHCFADRETWVKIHFSGLEGKVSITSTHFIRHEKYQDLNETTRNDVALVFFEGGLPPGHQPVSLLNDELNIGDELQMAGYGEGSPQGELSKIKLKVTEILDSVNLIKLNQTKKYGICHGDSGGPAFKLIGGQLFLVGVASYTEEANCTGYSVYTNATHFLNWINQKKSQIKSGLK